MNVPNESDAEPDRNEVRLRAFVESDLPAMTRLDASCFSPEIAYSRAEMTYFARHPRSTTIVAERGGQIVGFTIFDWRRERGSKAGHFITIDVAVVERRAGIGRRLMLAAEAAMRDEGCVAVVLEVSAANTSAQGFYERLGYERTGRIPGYYPDGTDALVLRRTLV